MLREFLPDLRPARVVILYYEGNDIADTSRELLNPHLRRYYFDDGFVQGLEQQHDAIDQQLRAWLDDGVQRDLAEEARRAPPPPPPMDTVRTIAALTSLRSLWGVALAECRAADTDKATARGVRLPKRAYVHILLQMRGLVERWGGRLYFVYLPTHLSVVDPGCDPERGTIEEIVVSAGIPFIDTTVALNARLDPWSLFVLHLTTEGYHAVAATWSSSCSVSNHPAEVTSEQRGSSCAARRSRRSSAGAKRSAGRARRATAGWRGPTCGPTWSLPHTICSAWRSSCRLTGLLQLLLDRDLVQGRR